MSEPGEVINHKFAEPVEMREDGTTAVLSCPWCERNFEVPEWDGDATSAVLCTLCRRWCCLKLLMGPPGTAWPYRRPTMEGTPL